MPFKSWIFLVLLAGSLASCRSLQLSTEERLNRSIYKYLLTNDTIIGRQDLYVYSQVFGQLYFQSYERCIDHLLERDSILAFAADSIRNCCIDIKDVNGRSIKWRKRKLLIPYNMPISERLIADSILIVKFADPVYLTKNEIVVSCGIFNAKMQGLGIAMLIEQRRRCRKIHVLKTAYCAYIN
jgi:hypothetical protein